MSVIRKLALAAAVLFAGILGSTLTVPAGDAVADCNWDMPCAASTSPAN